MSSIEGMVHTPGEKLEIVDISKLQPGDIVEFRCGGEAEVNWLSPDSECWGDDEEGGIFIDIGTHPTFVLPGVFPFLSVSHTECVTDMYSHSQQPRPEPPMLGHVTCTRIFYHTSPTQDTWLYAAFRGCFSYETNPRDCKQAGYNAISMTTEVVKLF